MQLNACQDALGKCFVQALVGSGLGTEAHFIVQGRSRRRNSIHQLVFRRLEKSFLLLAWSLYCFQKSGRARVAGEAGKPKNQGREFPVRLLGQLGACVGGQEFFGDRCCTTCLGAVLLSPQAPIPVNPPRSLQWCAARQRARRDWPVVSSSFNACVQPTRVQANFLALRFHCSSCGFLSDVSACEVVAEGSCQLLTSHDSRGAQNSYHGGNKWRGSRSRKLDGLEAKS